MYCFSECERIRQMRERENKKIYFFRNKNKNY